MSDQREVMYVGLKDRKTDNVAKTGCVWVGLGDVHMVTPLEAQALSRYPEIWADVTEWNDDTRISKINTVREQIRASRRMHVREVPLSLATLEELDAQRDRLMALGKKGHTADLSAATVRKETGNQRAPDPIDEETGQSPARPGSPKEVVAAIVGAVMTMDSDKPELFDGEGDPTLEAVVQALGYTISKSELKAALKEMNK